MKIEVCLSDITELNADCLITPVNSGGMWFGGIDGAIQRKAGDHYHQQLANAMPLENKQVMIAKGKKKSCFGDVVFVIDDLQSPLFEVVLEGLMAANEAGYKKVLIPAMRTGVMLGAYEKSLPATIFSQVDGIRKFLSHYVTKNVIESLTIVAYNDSKIQRLFESSLQSIS